jgi:hypothetical protein
MKSRLHIYFYIFDGWGLRMVSIETWILLISHYYCHISGVGVTNNNGFWIQWLDLFTLLYNYNQLWQLTLNDCRRLAPFLIGPWASSLPLWRMANHCSRIELPRTTSVWRNSLKNIGLISHCPECMNQLTFITATRTEYKSPCRTVNCPRYSVCCHRNIFVIIRCRGNRCLRAVA